MTCILVVDHDREFAELVRDGLRDRKYSAEAVRTAKEAIAFLDRNPVDIVVAHLHLRDVSGLELVSRLRDRHLETLGIVVTSQGSLETAVQAIRAGAYDFICKPVTLSVLEVAIERAVNYQALRREVQRLRLTVAASQPVDAILGDSAAIREVTSMIRRVAESPSTVLVTGESGTGKELVARAIHDLSDRKHQPFVAINCGALPPALLESELFGHVRGAFTDARQNRHGLFVQAGEGTLFLDEIGEMPLEMQVKLLRVLQERKLRPVGGDAEVTFGARLIAATNRDLRTAIDEQRFRQDLYHRINVVEIKVPPLRSRPGDVRLLAQRFIEQLSARSRKPAPKLEDDAVRKLIAYDWPGNVRELQNCIERVIALLESSSISARDLPEAIRDYVPSRTRTATGASDELVTLEELERRYIQQVLEVTRNNKSEAAKILGIDRRSLYRRLHDDDASPATTTDASTATTTDAPSQNN
ncbi:MAG TPA: sigma-54 dependent transcriptional regulator [Kofleriaceae bacterium]|nr:sigma-54 dependent transcriptional regulator [Kofleriaceae bacterium]